MLEQRVVGTPPTVLARPDDVRLALIHWFTRLATALQRAWADPMVRRGTLGMALVGVGSLTPTFLPPKAPVIEQLHLAVARRRGRPLRRHRAAHRRSRAARRCLAADAPARRPPRPEPHLGLLEPAGPARSAALQPRRLQLRRAGTHRPARSRPLRLRSLLGARSVRRPGRPDVDAHAGALRPARAPGAARRRHITGDNAYLAAVFMRLPALAAVALLAWALPRLAKRFGVSPSHALWLAVLNPLVIMHFVGGAHGDAVMVALVVLALYVASLGRFWVGAALIAAAASLQADRRPRARRGDRHGHAGRRHRRTGRVGPAALPHPPRCEPDARHRRLASRSSPALTGLGWGWTSNLSVPASLRSLIAPPTFVGASIEWFMNLAGMPLATAAAAVPIAQSIGLLVGLVSITRHRLAGRPAQAGAGRRGCAARARRLRAGHPPVVPPLGRRAPRRRAPLGARDPGRHLRDALLRHLRRGRRHGLQRHVGARRVRRHLDGRPLHRLSPPRRRGAPERALRPSAPPPPERRRHSPHEGDEGAPVPP